MPTVRDGAVTLDIELLSPPPASAAAPAPAGVRFLEWWRDECRLRNLPLPPFTGADRKVAQRLTNKHGEQTLKSLAVHYFRRHRAEVPKEAHEMVAFASRIPVIESELKDQAT